MRTNKELLVKSITYLVYTVFLMFLAPVVLFQAFKNQAHSLYPFVLQVGLLLVVAAIVMGFYSIYVMMLAIFGAKK